VSQKRVLGKILTHKKEEVAREKRKQHSEELHNLYTSPNVVKLINSKMG
jgi:hypothetical protein